MRKLMVEFSEYDIKRALQYLVDEEMGDDSFRIDTYDYLVKQDEGGTGIELSGVTIQLKKKPSRDR